MNPTTVASIDAGKRIEITEDETVGVKIVGLDLPPSELASLQLVLAIWKYGFTVTTEE